MLQEAEVRHTAHINQVAADQAKAAAATFAEQFKTILTPPALPRTATWSAPNGTAAAAAAHAEALAAERRRAVVEEELCAELRAQLNAPRGGARRGART